MILFQPMQCHINAHSGQRGPVLRVLAAGFVAGLRAARMTSSNTSFNPSCAAVSKMIIFEKSKTILMTYLSQCRTFDISCCLFLRGKPFSFFCGQRLLFSFG